MSQLLQNIRDLETKVFELENAKNILKNKRKSIEDGIFTVQTQEKKKTVDVSIQVDPEDVTANHPASHCSLLQKELTTLSFFNETLLEKIQVEKEDFEQDREKLALELSGLREKLESFNSIKLENLELEKQKAEITEQVENLKLEIHDLQISTAENNVLELEKSDLQKEVESLSTRLEKFEDVNSRNLELETKNSELDSQILQLKDRILFLEELEMRKLEAEKQNEELVSELKGLTLNSEKTNEMIEKLEKEKATLQSKVESLEGQVNTIFEELEMKENEQMTLRAEKSLIEEDLRELEKLRQNLDLQLENAAKNSEKTKEVIETLSKEKSFLQEKVQYLEEKFSNVDEEIKSKKNEQEIMITEKIIVEKQLEEMNELKKDLEIKLQSSKSEVAGLKDSLSQSQNLNAAVLKQNEKLESEYDRTCLEFEELQLELCKKNKELDTYSNKIEEAKKEINMLTEEKNEISDQVAKVTAECNLLSETLITEREKYEVDKKDLNDKWKIMEETNLTLSNVLDSTRQQLAETRKSLHHKTEQLEETLTVTKKSEDSKTHLENKAEDLLLELDNVRMEVSGKDGLIYSLQGEISELKEEFCTLEASCSALNNALTYEKSISKGLADKMDKSEIIHAEFQVHAEQTIHQLEQNLAQAHIDLEEANAKNSELEEEKSKALQEVAELKEIDESNKLQILTIQQKVDSLEKRLSQVLSANENLENDVRLGEEELNKISIDLEETKSETKQLIEQIAQLEDGVEYYKSQYEEIQALLSQEKEAHKITRQSEKALQHNVKKLEKTIANMEDDICYLQKDIIIKRESLDESERKIQELKLNMRENEIMRLQFNKMSIDLETNIKKLEVVEDQKNQLENSLKESHVIQNKMKSTIAELESIQNEQRLDMEHSQQQLMEQMEVVNRQKNEIVKNKEMNQKLQVEFER